MNKIAIIGAGAVGSFYGARLAGAGNDVHFLLRSDYDHVAQHGIQVFSPLGNFRLFPVNAHQTPSTIGACDLIIIALKATANASLEGVLPLLMHDATVLLTLQNGLGNEEFLAGHFGANRVLGGKCFVCLNRTAPGVISHIGHGVISLGEFQRTSAPRTHELAEMFRASGIPCNVCEDIEDVLWRKLVWNIPFNGLAIASGGMDVGQILANSGFLQRTRILMREVIAIARAKGVLIEDSFEDFQINRTRPMGNYRPSSLLDWQAGREVEIEAIWGEPLRCAQSLGIDAPELKQLHEELKIRIRQD